MNNKYNIKFSTYKTDLIKEVGIDAFGVLRKLYVEQEFPAIVINEYDEYKILATIVNNEITLLVVPSDHKEVRIENLFFEYDHSDIYKLIKFYFNKYKGDIND